ncbi:hypothetical protein AMATHDRAFT_50519 [Amanita thiersii Skay4041]|uniref:Cell wall protein PhiA n=1 Tax=Amanita thiersii Skay4041 TaxID=703135 RepID=A0A2A9NHK8_9AGAR|nr:hypothetical protein AMATHDRAFT_50519 [Amanita thiersii Skay4041]
MKFTFSALLSAAALFSVTSAVVVPGADTPEFYLVASSGNSGANLLPLRTNGGAGGYATLTGSGPIGKFYFYQGKLVAAIDGSTATQRPLIGSVLGPTGCTTYGSLGFTQGSSSNKCARYDSFYIRSNEQNSQLGAKLTFNWVGEFYACGSAQDVWYKVNPDDGPGGVSPCNRIDLYTVPVL